MTEPSAIRGRNEVTKPTPVDEAGLDESARREALRTGAPGTVGTRVVIRECGNVRPRGGFRAA